MRCKLAYDGDNLAESNWLNEVQDVLKLLRHNYTAVPGDECERDRLLLQNAGNWETWKAAKIDVQKRSVKV